MTKDNQSKEWELEFDEKFDILRAVYKGTGIGNVVGNVVGMDGKVIGMDSSTPMRGICNPRTAVKSFISNLLAKREEEAYQRGLDEHDRDWKLAAEYDKAVAEAGEKAVREFANELRGKPISLLKSDGSAETCYAEKDLAELLAQKYLKDKNISLRKETNGSDRSK